MNRENDKEAKITQLIRMVDGSEISSIKQVLSGVMNIIDDPESTAKELKDMIELDPPLTGKVLQVANSAYYAVQRRVSSIEQAVILIGFDAVKEMALNLKVCEIFASGDSIDGYSRLLLWKHSIAVGLLGRMIYRREFRKRGEKIYVAGLLHEIGIIAEDQFLHDQFKDILSTAKEKKQNLSKTEIKKLGYNHAELGKAITGHWNLPEDIIMCIGYHHHPVHAPEEFLQIASTLYIADYLCQTKKIGYCDAPFADRHLFGECLKILDIKPHSLDLIMADMEDEFSKLESQGLFI